MMANGARLSRPYETDQPFSPYLPYRPQKQVPQRKAVASNINVIPVREDDDTSLSRQEAKPSPALLLVLEPTSWARFLSRVNNWWLLEFGSLVLSVGALATLAGVLNLYEGRPLDDWKYTLKLNTVVSFITIVLKTTLVMAVSSAMGQLKWVWYSGPRSSRPLADFQAFDDASRGPWGSFKLLFRRPDLAFLAAFIILLALAIEPFVQQSINTALLPTISTVNSSIPIASQYNLLAFGSTLATKEPELPMKAAMFDGLFYSNTSQTPNNITPECATGNCTFDEYRTVSVCSKCIDITSLVKSQSAGCPGLTCGWILPNGVNMTGQSGVLSTGTGALNTNELNTGEELISTFSAMGRSNYYSEDVKAVDCILYFCVQTYYSTVINGVFEETLVDSVRMIDRVDRSQAFYSLAATVGDPSSALGRQTFKIDGDARLAVNTYTQNLLNGYVLSTNGFLDSSSDALQAIFDKNPTNTSASIENLATAMSSRIRLAGDENALGQATVLVTFIEARWVWLLMPLGLEALTFLVLVGTVVLTARRKVPAWKVSALAPMFHGAGQEVTRTYKAENMDEMMTAAEKVLVSLVNEDGCRALKKRNEVMEDELPLTERVAFAGSDFYGQHQQERWNS